MPEPSSFHAYLQYHESFGSAFAKTCFSIRCTQTRLSPSVFSTLYQENKSSDSHDNMAICAEVPGVEVTVNVAGNKATEYDDVDGHQGDRNEKQASHRVFAYIESLDNACFSVTVSASTYKFATENERLVFDLYVDGKRQSDQVLGRSLRTATIEGVEQKKSKEWQLNLFKFSSIRTSSFHLYSRIAALGYRQLMWATASDGESTQVEKDIKVSKDLGLIQVRVIQALYIGELNDSDWCFKPSKCPVELTEKSLKGKAVSHGTS